jgi:hypothetical protein
MNRLSNIGSFRFSMRAKREVQTLAIFGVASLIFSFSEIEIGGPWDSPSFTRGVVGLLGLACLYFAWFGYTFGKFGIVPSQSMWKNPKKSSGYIFLFGCVLLLVTQLFQTSYFIGKVPEPAGLLLTFIACLAILNALYVQLSMGILSEEE